MKKLFTFLLLFTALLWGNKMSAAETLIWDVDYNQYDQNGPSNFQLYKDDAGNYRLVVKNSNYPASFGRMNDEENGFSRDEVTKFKDSKKKITIKGTFGNIEGLKKDFKFEEVDLKEFVMTSNNTPINFTSNYYLKDFFKHAKKVILPNYVTDAYVNFFLEMSNKIEEITFGSNTKRILCNEQNTNVSSNGVWSAWEREQNPDPQGNYPIRNAPALKTLIFNDGLEEIGTNAFLNCANITSLTFPTSLKVIHINAFKHTKEITSLDFSNNKNLTTIDASAFAGKSNKKGERSKLNSVTLPPYATFTGFGNYVFSSTSIEELDFRNCTGITRFLHDGGTNDPQYQGKLQTFYYYSSLKRIWFPPNLTYLMPNAFGGNANNLEDPDHTSTILEEAYFTGHITKNDYDLSTCGNPITDESKTNTILEGKGLVIDEYAFNNVQTLKTVQFSNNVTKIGPWAFYKTHLTTVSIPASVQEIGQMAFNENDYLETVIFEDITDDCKPCKGAKTLVKGGGKGAGAQSSVGAFWNCKAIRDIYFKSDVPLECENLAFVFDVTYGHADPYASLATLHFPEELTENYANLDHYLTDQVASNPGLFHRWLHEHFQQAKDPKGNGWYEFVNAGPTKGNIDDPKNVCQDIILRTFSDWNYSYLVPEGIRAYVVNNIEKNGNVYELTLQRLLAIPAKTGVILYGHPNGKNTLGQPILSMTPISFAKEGQNVKIYDNNGNVTYEGPAKEDQGLPLCRANWYKKDGKTPLNYVKNYLEPTSTPSQADVTKLYNKLQSETDATKKAALKKEYDDLVALIDANPAWKNKKGELNGGLFVKPFENEITSEDPYDPYNYNSDKPVTFRNFAMSRYNKTHHLSGNRSLKSDEVNYEAFFRMIADYYPSGKAYLRLKADPNEYDEPTGAEIIVKEDKGPDGNYGDGCYYTEYSKNDGAPINTRREYTKAGHGMNPLGWWVKEHGFDWNIVDENYQYQEEDGTPILDEDGNEIIKSRMNWGSYPERFRQNPSLRYLGELGEDADGIVKLVIPADDNANDEYYTLQGVKVINPTKGVYIHNGKKVVIK